MKLNLISNITEGDLRALEDYLFDTDPRLKELIAIRDVDATMKLSDEDMKNLFPEYMGEEYEE